MLQGQRDLLTVGKMLLSELAPLVEAQQGAIFQMSVADGDVPVLRRLAGYANERDEFERIAVGEGLVGQCAHGKERILLEDVPADYAPIRSSLGEARPMNVVVLPVLFEGQTKAVIELASLHPFTAAHLNFLEQLSRIHRRGAEHHPQEATMRTEGLLQQSQQLTAELQSGTRRSCSKPTRNSARRHANWRSKTRRWSARTWRSIRPVAPSRTRRRNLPSPRSTSPNSSQTCPMSFCIALELHPHSRATARRKKCGRQS